MDRAERLERGELEEIGGRMRQRDDQRVVVRRLHADLGEIGDLARAVGLAVDEVVELVGVLARRWRDRARAPTN